MQETPPPVHVMHVVYALHPGGMEHGVVKLVNGLLPLNVRSAICATVPDGPLRSLVDRDVPVIELRRRPGNDPALVPALYRTFRAHRPDIVHTHAWGTLCEGLVAARLARVPVIVHGEHGTLQLKPYQARVQRLAWNRVDRLLAVSSRLADRMAASTRVKRDRIGVIRNGVDLSRFGVLDRAAARQALGLPAEVVVIGTAGRLVAVKDQAMLLDAVALLRGRGVDASVVLAGDGPLLPDLQGQVETLGMAGAVRFLGHRTDIERVFAALDIFVLSSVSEGLSNTILEAMASGLPVVATDVGGADELVIRGVTGLLVPAQAPAAMAGALEPLVRQPELRERMGTAGRLRATQEFGIDRMLRDYADLYHGLAGGRQPALQVRRHAAAGADRPAAQR